MVQLDCPFASKDHVFPDLAFSYIVDRSKYPSERMDTKKIVGVSPIAYLSQYGWPQKKQSVYQQYFAVLTDFIAHLLNNEYSIILFYTDTPDLLVINDLKNTLLDQMGPEINERMSAPTIERLDQLFLQLDKADFIVASRLHGLILSHLCLKPAIAISYDRKVDTYFQQMEFSDYCVDIHNLQFKDLVTKFDLLTQSSDLVNSTLKTKVSAFREDLNNQYEIALRNI